MKEEVEIEYLKGINKSKSSEKISRAGWQNQGVIVLHKTLTTAKSLTPKPHEEYWSEFHNNTLKFISRVQPCQWIIWSNAPFSFLKVVYKPVHVNKYLPDNINNMPLFERSNYVHTGIVTKRDKKFNSTYYFDVANVILKNRVLTKIKW